MEELRWLEIENYRGIKSAKFENFGDINLIVGKNNTGKSTILEAIYLNVANANLDLLGRDPFVVIFTKRGFFPLLQISLGRELDIEDVFRILNYIFYLGNYDSPIKLNSNLLNYGFNLLKEDIPTNLKDIVVRHLTSRYVTKRPEVEVAEILFLLVDTFQRPLITAIEEIYKETVRYDIRFLSRGTYIKDFKLKRRTKSRVVLIDTHLLLSTDIIGISQIQRLITHLEKETKINREDFVNFISKQLELDIVSVESKIGDIYLATSDDRLIPLSLLGDGTKMAIAYYYTLSLKDSIILFEEPENHLHPKLMDTCVDLILKSSEHNQIFITTHNIEFLQKIIGKAQESDKNLKVVSIFSLKNGIPEFDYYTLEEADAAINKIGVDLR